MSTVWLYTLGSVVLVSLVSIAGIVTLFFRAERWKQALHYLISFSAGVMLGDVFLHMIPEIAEHGFGVREGLYFLAGILAFFILERAILWHHSHTEHKETVHSMVYLTIIGDSLHNFVDGLVIAGSFLVSLPLGIATTLAVVFHEIPHEIGDFGVLVHGGWSKAKALYYNFLSALTAILGAVVVLVFAERVLLGPTVLLSFGAASFIYIALSDLVPEMHKELAGKRSVFQLLGFVAGAALMGAGLFLE